MPCLSSSTLLYPQCFLHVVVLWWIGILPSLAAPPANDHFAAAIALSGLPVAVVGNTAEATREVGEPGNASGNIQSSVWWTWTCPVAGWVEFNAASSNTHDFLTAREPGTSSRRMLE